SSRRRHTRSKRDWSSDVCSSDLLSFTSTIMNQPLILLSFWGIFHGIFVGMLAAALTEVLNVFPILSKRIGVNHSLKWLLMAFVRSEERRVGKERRSGLGWSLLSE